MRALVIGASGLVGGALIRALGAEGTGTYRSRPAPGLRQLDAREPSSLRIVLRDSAPELVFFPAADANVDWCESHPNEARSANVGPALNALAATSQVGARFVFFSSDYVFDGEDGPYDEGHAPAPLSVYGRHKRDVEEAVLEAGGTVIRTTTVFGDEAPPGKNFVVRLVAALNERRVVTVPLDQWSTPTWSEDLARASVRAAVYGGIWNVAGPDVISRFELARLVAQVFELDPSPIRSATTSELHQAARRPSRGGLRTSKLIRELGVTPLSTADALESFRAASGIAPRAFV